MRGGTLLGVAAILAVLEYLSLQAYDRYAPSEHSPSGDGPGNEIGPRSNCGSHHLIVQLRSLAFFTNTIPTRKPNHEHRRPFCSPARRKPGGQTKKALRQRIGFPPDVGRVQGLASLQFSLFRTEECKMPKGPNRSTSMGACLRPLHNAYGQARTHPQFARLLRPRLAILRDAMRTTSLVFLIVAAIVLTICTNSGQATENCVYVVNYTNGAMYKWHSCDEPPAMNSKRLTWPPSGSTLTLASPV
jgi:hypothetical protein